MKTKIKRNKGFTLIELLVVISIISLLSSVVLASISVVKRKATATAYTQGVLQLKKALDAYKIDTGNYPHEVPTPDGNQASYYQYIGSNLDDVLDVLTPDYISSIPSFGSYLSNDYTYISPYAVSVSFPSEYTCDGTPLTYGFVLIIYGYDPNLYPYITLPKYYINGDEMAGVYCVTGTSPSAVTGPGFEPIF